MNIETKSMHITPSGGYVFADLGFASTDAAELNAESQRIISGQLTAMDTRSLELVETPQGAMKP